MRCWGIATHAGLMATGRNEVSAVALGRRDKSDVAVAVLEVVAIHERRHPGAGFFPTLDGIAGDRPAGPRLLTTSGGLAQPWS